MLSNEAALHAWLRWDVVTGRKSPVLKTLHKHGLLNNNGIEHVTDSQLLNCGFRPDQLRTFRTSQPAQLARVQSWQALSDAHHVVSFGCDLYPDLLREIYSPPPLLFVYGNPHVLSSRQIAAVGSRRPTESAKRVALTISRELAQCGFTVTSGMALGIDGCCHRGALQGQGRTIAVLGSGVDVLYPSRHTDLARQIVATDGALVSEFLPGTRPKAEHFPRRNRIVSGMSLGTLVVEAAIKSGSLITARYALEQDREVFAVPGSVHNVLASGCHYLIKQGAKLVESIEDIVEEFQNLSLTCPERAEKNLMKSPLQCLASDPLLDSVGYEVTAVDVVADRSNMPVRAVLATLLEYELRGLVASVPGGYIKLGEK